MKTKETIFKDTVEIVNTSFPSVFSKEDVIFLLGEMKKEFDALDEETQVVAVEKIKLIESLKENVLEILENYCYDSDIELDFAFDRRIEVSFDENSLVREVEKEFNQFKSESH